MGQRTVALVGALSGPVVEELGARGWTPRPCSEGSILQLAQAVSGSQARLIHARTAHLRAAVLGRALDLPVLLEVDGAATAAKARAARLAERTLCSGSVLREELVALGAPANRLVVPPPLLDFAELSRAASSGCALPAGPGVDTLVCLSPLRAKDAGQLDALEAFETVARTHPRARLIAFGEGLAAERFIQSAQSLGLTARVAVLPLTRETFARALGVARAAIAPTRDVLAQDLLLEALALAVPTVATNVGPAGAFLSPGRTGWLVPARCPASMAARLVQILDAPSSALEVSGQARSQLLELARPGAVATELVRAYAKLSRTALQPTSLTPPLPLIRSASRWGSC